jgi:hypothetical protein
MSNEITPTPVESERHPIPPSPIHPLAALATVVLDNVFGWFEFVDPFALLITSVVVGGLGFLTTLFVQRYLSKDGWGASVAKALVMGVVSGVPYPVTGTVIGIPLLAWAGLHKWIKLPAPTRQAQLPPEEEIVEAEVKDIEQNS